VGVYTLGRGAPGRVTMMMIQCLLVVIIHPLRVYVWIL
jgi:hypothetical protein